MWHSRDLKKTSIESLHAKLTAFSAERLERIEMRRQFFKDQKEAGVLLGILQCGESLNFPSARPMPNVGSRCLELRVKDKTAEWRIFCRVDADAVLMVHVMAEKIGTRQSGVARMLNNPSKVTIDILIKTLLVLGTPSKRIAALI